MTSDSERGFTIIEVILFLAIAGLLFAILMVSVGGNIARERYLDGVRSFRTLLEAQYDAAANTENVDFGGYKCNAGAGVGGLLIGSRDPRGTSKCLLLGRAIRLSNPVGAWYQSVDVSSVTGIDLPPTFNLTTASDSSALNTSNPIIADFDKRTIDLAWSISLKKISGPTFDTIVILRSPASGAIRVYLTQWSSVNLTLSSGGSAAELCVGGDTGLQTRKVITIDPNADKTNFVFVKDQGCS